METINMLKKTPQFERNNPLQRLRKTYIYIYNVRTLGQKQGLPKTFQMTTNVLLSCVVNNGATGTLTALTAPALGLLSRDLALALTRRAADSSSPPATDLRCLRPPLVYTYAPCHTCVTSIPVGSSVQCLRLLAQIRPKWLIGAAYPSLGRTIVVREKCCLPLFMQSHRRIYGES